VLLVVTQVLDDALLLVKFGMEKLLVRLVLISELFVGLRDELGLVTDSLQEGIIDLSLNIILMELSLVVLVGIEYLLDVFVKVLLILVECANNLIVLALLFLIGTFSVLQLLSQLLQVLNLGGEELLAITNLSLNLVDHLSNFLEGLALFIIEHFFLVGNTLDLLLNLGVALDTLLGLKLLHELFHVLGSRLKNLSSSVKDLNFILDLLKLLLHLLVLSILAP
jgi:hypothetical protein